MGSHGGIVIIGPYPPPIGGIAMHAQRLAERCLASGQECHLVDPYGSPSDQEPPWVVRFRGSRGVRFTQMVLWLIRNPYYLVHIHVSAMDKFLAVGLLIYLSTLKARLRVITIHSGSFVRKVESRNRFMKWIAADLLGRYDHVIVVNKHQQKFLSDFLKVKPEKIHVIPAFIPSKSGTRVLPDSVKSIRKCPFLVVGSGYATRLYAHELLLEAVARLQNEGINIGLVIAVYTQYEEPYFSELKERTSRMPNTLLLEELDQKTFNAILEQADMYVRTARFDGDSVAVREALFHGCRVVASDCVERPEACNIFATDDADSLYMTMKRVMQGVRNVPYGSECRDYSQDILAVYGL